MIIEKPLVALLLILPLVLGSCEAEEQVSSDEALLAFFEANYQEDLARSPEMQSYRGIKTDYDKWGDYSEKAQDEDHQRNLARRAELGTFDYQALSPRLQLSYKIYQATLERAIESQKYRYQYYSVGHSYGPHTGLPNFMIGVHQIADLEDARAYVSRLMKVNQTNKDNLVRLKLLEEHGTLAPAWAYPQAIQGAKNIITGAPFDDSGIDSPLYGDIKSKLERLEADEAEKAQILEEAKTALLEDVLPEYQKLIAEYEHQLSLTNDDDGVWKLKDGDAFYAMRLRHYTTTDLTPQEIHDIGLENVARIHNEMRGIMDKVGFEGTLQDFFQFMKEDPQFYLASTDEGRAEYLARATEVIDTMRERLPEVFNIFPKAELEVKAVETYRERSASGAFYSQPAHDGSRPGIFYVNLYDMSTAPTYRIEGLAYHEGLPGHHMQIAIQYELENVPNFQKSGGFTAYIEGWGLYSELLPKEMGFYQDPYSDFGRLTMELWRACRLVVDTGLHYKRWTREEAIQYLLENTPNSTIDVEKSIERYIMSPGQATAYLIGKLKIVELREKARADLGDRFDIRGFHDEVLKDGPVPLDMLEDKIDNWVASQREM